MFKLNATKIISCIKNNNYRLILTELEDGMLQIMTNSFAVITDDMEFIEKIKQETEKWAAKKKLSYTLNADKRSAIFDEELPYDLYTHTETRIKNISFFIDSNGDGGLHAVNTDFVEIFGLREAYSISVNEKSVSPVRFAISGKNCRYYVVLMPISIDKRIINVHKRTIKAMLDYCENDGAN